jgi:hypothetical protein
MVRPSEAEAAFWPGISERYDAASAAAQRGEWARLQREWFAAVAELLKLTESNH